jgi:hypothetical protein
VRESRGEEKKEAKDRRRRRVEMVAVHTQREGGESGGRVVIVAFE